MQQTSTSIRYRLLDKSVANILTPLTIDPRIWRLVPLLNQWTDGANAPNTRMQSDRFAREIGPIFTVPLALAAADAQPVRRQSIAARACR